MAQKPLKKQGKAVQAKQSSAANKHGKSQMTTKRGKLTVAPKRAATKRSHGDNQKLTKAINAENESHFAAMAAKGGGHLALLQPPATATAQDKGKGGVRPAKGPGKVWGASSKQ
uniref:Uncharacterized protein n=1 Tax=Auxenochlorella protothecoides TaxID=3075 RepID=A0A1D2AA02_AUXPR